MEMHQIRYFAGGSARTLELHPCRRALQRLPARADAAIQQLEDELGGQLLRREGKLSHLTDLGERMLPLVHAVPRKRARRQDRSPPRSEGLLADAPSLALVGTRSTWARGAVPGRDAAPMPQASQFKIAARHGNRDRSQHLKKGQAELRGRGSARGDAGTGSTSMPLFEEELAADRPPRHRLAGRAAQWTCSELAEERILVHSDCEAAAGIARQLDEHGVAAAQHAAACSRSTILSR